MAVVTHLSYVHHFAEAVSIATLVLSILLLRHLSSVSWEMLTSQMFERNQSAIRYFRWFVYLLVLFSVFSASEHIIGLLRLRRLHWLSDMFQALSLLSVMSGMALLHRMFHQVER